MLCLEAKKAARPTRNLVLKHGRRNRLLSWRLFLTRLTAPGSPGMQSPRPGSGSFQVRSFWQMHRDAKWSNLPWGPATACLMSWRAKRPNVRENVRSLYSQGSDCRVIFSPIPVESFPFAVLYPTSRLWSLVTNLWMAICFVNIYKDADLSRGRWSKIN